MKTNFGYIIRSLLVKKYFVGFFDDETISRINSELRPLNMRVEQTHQKNKLILVDSEPTPIQNSKILENLDNHFLLDKKMDKNTIDYLISLNWYEDNVFTDAFFIQNEEYLLEKFNGHFIKCSFCNILIHTSQVHHKFCKNLYEKHLNEQSHI